MLAAFSFVCRRDWLGEPATDSDRKGKESNHSGFLKVGKESRGGMAKNHT